MSESNEKVSVFGWLYLILCFAYLGYNIYTIISNIIKIQRIHKMYSEFEGFGFEFNGMTDEKAREILGVGKNATKSDIKKAYRKMAMKHHPDHGGNKDEFININSAYEFLYATTS